MGCAASSRKEPIPGHACESVEPASTPSWDFPMYLVPVTEFLLMTGPPLAHQLLRQDGKVVVWQRGRICIFISHQWLSFRHPDPDGRQLQALRRALEKLLSGDLVVEAPPIMEALMPKRDLPKWHTKNEEAKLRGAWVWYDFFSNPQLELGSPCLEDIDLAPPVGIQDHRQSDESTVVSDMVAAVASIPVYVQLSHYFLIAAPPMYHRNTKELCDFASWTKRGWCRVEFWSHVLREGRTHPVVLVRSDSWAQFVSTWSWPFWRVQDGELTAESDRSIITELTDSMLQRKLKHMETSPHDIDSQYLSAMHRALVGKSAFDMDERAFRARFGLQSLGGGSPEEMKGLSYPPVICAALAGQPRLVELCLHARCSVDAPLRKSHQGILHCPKGWNALHATVYFRPLRQLEVLEVLLQARANVERPHELGMPPLHNCTTPVAVEILLRYRAELHRRNPFGDTALIACAGFPGNADTVATLLHRGAVLEPAPKGLGSLPLWNAAALNDDSDVVRVLLANRANPNATANPQGAFKLIGRALAAYYGQRMEGASPFMRLVADLNGLTAIGAAASAGKAEMVLQLLDARASPCQVNWRGSTAQELAEREGFFNLFSDVAIVEDAARCADEMNGRSAWCIRSAAGPQPTAKPPTTELHEELGWF